MATPIPPRRPRWYYLGLWIALTVASFIWVVIDSFDVLSQIFPALEEWEPGWMGATVEIAVFPLVVLIASGIFATIVVVRKAAAEANPRARLTRVYERMASLINTWEDGHVAGPDAHQNDVANLYEEADDIIGRHYSASEAARFRDVKPQDALAYDASEELDDARKRELLLDAKAKFIYDLLAAGKRAGE